MIKSAVSGEKKFQNIESELFGPRSMNNFDLWYTSIFMYSFYLSYKLTSEPSVQVS